MFLYFFVEEQSMEMALNYLLPNILPEQSYYQIITFEGKPDLLDNIQDRLTAYAKFATKEYRFVVIVDRDDDECHQLKDQLEQISLASGLTSKSRVSIDQRFNIINRIAIEELESWYFGDPEALRAAFPKLSQTFERRQKYRDPENITGGTWEALEYLLQRKGYYETGLAKVDLASKVAPFMRPEANCTRSFQVFHQGVLELIHQNN